MADMGVQLVSLQRGAAKYNGPMMTKFRVLSDLHIDYNESRGDKFEMPKDDIFTVLCGDTSGDPAVTISWVKENIKSGLLIAGNHLPYNNQNKTMQELRQQLADAFPKKSDVTYLDVETGVFSKEIDGILFVGTTFYTNFRISHEWWNSNGDKEFNMRCSHGCMNDYIYGFSKREFPLGADNEPKMVRVTPQDYYEWFINAFKKIDELLVENEKAAEPKPVVLISHHALVKDTIEKNGYVEQHFDSPRHFNYSSYASDCGFWLKSHPSIKCYLYGHIHDIYPEHRSFKLKRDDGSQILVLNNCRGYVSKGHDLNFNPNTFVNVQTWEVEQIPETEEQIAAKKERAERRWKSLAWFM